MDKLDKITNGCFGHYETDEIVIKARAAINKAKGE